MGVSQSPPLKRPRRVWRWVRRALIAGAVLLLLLAVFHRPLIFTLVRWVAPKFASSQGLPLEWQIDGSLWNNLNLRSVKTGGGEAHWLPRASIGELQADYDWRAFIIKDYEHAVRRVKLHEADVEVDLRHLPTAEPAPITPSKQPNSSGPPPIVWPRTVDLKNIHLTLTLPDGSRLAIRGFTLQIGEGMPGIFECKELRREPDGPVLENLSAQVIWETRRFSVKNLTLPKQIILEQLAVDLDGLWSPEGAATLQLDARLGPAMLAIKASVTGIFQAPLLVQASLEGSNLRADELHTLGLPKDISFDQTRLNMKAIGDPAKLETLDVSSEISIQHLRTSGAQVDQIEWNAKVAAGRAQVQSLKITRGSNILELTAEATQLIDWPKSPWTATLKSNLPQVTQFLDKAPPFQGLFQLNASAEGMGPTPTQVTAKIDGESLAFESYKLPKLLTEISLNGREAKLEIPNLGLGDGNTLNFNAKLLMEDTMPVEATWKLTLTDPAKLFQTVGLKAPPKPVQAKVDLQGKTAFKVADLSVQKFSEAIADLNLRVSDLHYGQGQMESLSLQMKVEKGQAVLDSLIVKLDETNRLQFTAQAAVEAPHRFTTQGNLQLPQLTGLNQWLQEFGTPVIQKGALVGQLDATGELQPWQCRGNLKLKATDVKTDVMTEMAQASIETTFEGTRAELKQFEASLGPWRFSTKGQIDDQRADLTELNLWQNQTALLTGHARAPFDLIKPDIVDGQTMDLSIQAKDLRIHEVLAAAGIKNIPPGVFNADIQLRGRLENTTGKVQIHLRDVKVPNGPKAFQAASLKLDTTLEKKKLTTAIVVQQPPLQSLTVEASLPMDLAAIVKKPESLNQTPIQAKVRLAETDLSFLREYAPDMLRTLPARMSLNADVTGTVAAPLIKSQLDLEVAEITWMKPDLPSVRDVRVRIRSDDRRINIEDVSAVLAGGRVKLIGRVDATDLQKPLLDLSLEAREALVFRDPTTSLRANADITCRGDLQKAAVVGLVEAVRGRVFKEIDLMPVLKLPADVPPVPADTQRSEAKLTLPPAVKDWTFDVKVRTRDPLLISGNLANGAVTADVLLSGTGANPRLTGGANVDRLLLKLPFSMVNLTKGVITLRPDHPFDPDLDIRGESRIGSNDITLYIYGDSTNPKTRFTSTPPMSEPDIVTLLATGTTLNGSASDLASEAATRAAFLFITEFYRKTFNKKKVVRESPPKLNLTFNPSGADRSNDSVQASYDLTENWRVTGRFTQTGRMKALLGYVLRFGKAAQAMDDRAKPRVLPAPPVSSPAP